MTSRRAQSYGRVMETLRSVGAVQLRPSEEERIREAADTLLFCDDVDADLAARRALDEVRDLTRRLAAAGRWTPEGAERLLDDVAGCGPVLLLV